MKIELLKQRLRDGRETVEYQLQPGEMMDGQVLKACKDGTVSGILSMGAAYEEGHNYIYAYTDKRKTMVEAFKEVVTRRLILCTFESIVSTLSNMEEKGINLAYVPLDSQYIYLEEDTGKAGLICMPGRNAVLKDGEIQTFFRNILANAVYLNSEDGDYVAKLLSALNKEFDLKSFLRQIHGLMMDAGIEIIEEDISEEGKEEKINQMPERTQPAAPAVEPVAAEFLQPEISAAEPVVAEPVQPAAPAVEPVVAEPLQPELPAAEPVVAEPVQPAAPAVEPVVAEPLQPELPVVEPVVAESVQPAAPAVEPVVAEPVQPAAPAVEPVVAEPLQPELPAAEPVVAESVQLAAPAVEPVVAESVQLAAPAVEPVVAESVQPAAPAVEPVVAEPVQPAAPTQPEISSAGTKMSETQVNTSLLSEDDIEFEPMPEEMNAKIQRMNVSSTPQNPPVTPAPSVPRVPQSQGAVPASSMPQIIPQDASFQSGQKRPNPHLIRLKTGENISLPEGRFVIGKSQTGVDYMIADNAAISRIHCTVFKKNGAYYVRDERSTNGTFVNGEQVLPETERLLLNNCKLILGDEEFLYSLW